ncbi:MAG: hypothetical protein HKO90_08600, partial [Flavobacteriaceae bacterium]|nr:hypothetical protein [Flavobacteriaceae bacterium]
MAYLDNYGIPYKNELFILGYSQGGHAAVSLLKKIENKTFSLQNLKLKSAVAIAAPYKLKENVDFILEKVSFPSTAYVSYLFISLNQRQWNRQMNEFFKDSSLYYINEHLNGNVSLNKMAIKQSDYIDELVQDKILTDYLGDKEIPLKNSLRANSDFNFTPRTPLLIIHSKSDEVVPYQTSLDTWQQWICNG